MLKQILFKFKSHYTIVFEFQIPPREIRAEFLEVALLLRVEVNKIFGSLKRQF